MKSTDFRQRLLCQQLAQLALKIDPRRAVVHQHQHSPRAYPLRQALRNKVRQRRRLTRTGYRDNTGMPTRMMDNLLLFRSKVTERRQTNVRLC